MKRIGDYILTVLTAMVLSTGTMAAQTVDPIDSVPSQAPIIVMLCDSGNFTIDQPASLAKRLERTEGLITETENEDTSETASASRRGRSGYRVEVFADNNVRTAKVQAASRKRQIEQRLPQYRAYLVFESPFWRVRMGDFTTRAEAEAAMADVRRVLPSLKSGLRIVRSNINQQ